MKENKKTNLNKTMLAAMFLAVALVLPFLTAQIREIGNMLCPMHIPVLLCGYICGPWYGLAVGFIAPLLRFALFGMPPVMPMGIGMAFELATYGFVVGMLYKRLPKNKLNVYVSLLSAMIIGRIVWGCVRTLIAGANGSAFGWTAFIAGAFLNAIPGIIIQIVLIPLLVIKLEKISKKQ